MGAKIPRRVGNERSAEVVEWIAVVVVLALVAAALFGPDPVLENAIREGIASVAAAMAP